MGIGHGILLGSDHTDYGAIEIRALAPDLALGITRGHHPKPYRFVDPNEDVVAAVVGARATLLVVADGHNGMEASDVAVATVLEHLGGDPPEDLDRDGWLGLFHAAGEAVLRATRPLPPPNRESRTTLTVALVTPGRVAYASLGDSALFVADATGAREVTRSRHRFVGHPMTLGDLAVLLDRGRTPLDAGAWVVLASDGFTNFARGATPAAAITPFLDGSLDAAAVARELIEEAGAGGAGDNVAVVVHGPLG